MNWIASDFMKQTQASWQSEGREREKKLFNFCSFSCLFFRDLVADTPFFMSLKFFALLCGMTESQQELKHEIQDSKKRAEVLFSFATENRFFGCVVPFSFVLQKTQPLMGWLSDAEH